jgi:glycosylphosphatidylinositol transamidase (GPIT) subunit GPI8
LNGLDFGATVDSPSINFIPAIDLNGEDIRIPYDNYEVTFDNLLRNYLDHSSCRDKIKGEPYF